VELELQTDNLIRVVDKDNGYAFLLSEDWLPVLQGFKAVKDASNFISKTDPQISSLLNGYLNDRNYRVIAFNQNGKNRNESIVTNLYVKVDNMFSAIPLDKATAQLAGGAPSQGLSVNKNGVEYGYIQGGTTRNIGGKPVKVYLTWFLVRLDNSDALFELLMPDENGKDIAQELIDTVELIKK
jgi:hypothetical protein